MKESVKRSPHPLLPILAEISALAATLYLFLVPAFKKYQGVIFPGSPPPGLETGWQHFGFWPPIPSTPPDMFVMYLMIAPPVIAGLGVLFGWIGRGPARATILWSLSAMMVVTLLPRLFDFGFFFIPAAAFLLSAALKETFDVVDRKIEYVYRVDSASVRGEPVEPWVGVAHLRRQSDRPEIELMQRDSASVRPVKGSASGLIKVGFILAVIGWLALFFIPVFSDSGRVVSAWDKYSWNSNSAPIVFIFFTVPLVAAGAGFLAGRMRNAPSRKIALWIIAGVMVFLVLLNAAVYSLYYLPAAILFLAAAFRETFSIVEARNEGFKQ